MAPGFLSAGGEMGALMRDHDWSRHPLGPPEGWPHGLKTALRLLLNTGHPAYIFWGEPGYCFYNDGYRPSIGPERHPGSLGRPVREVWAEIWPIIGPQIAQVLAGRGATWHENQLVPITRHGRLEDVYWTYSYSPIDDEAAPHGVGGVLVICTETTQQVHARRQAAAARDRQRMTLQQMPGFVALLSGPEHRYEYVNDAYVEIAGARDFIGRTVREVFPDIADQGFYQLLDRVYATGEPFGARAMPIRLNRPDGARFIDLLYQPMRDDAGEITGIFVGGYDVTELVRTTERLLLATEHAEIGFWDVDLVKGDLVWPARTKAMFGISPDVPVSMADFYAGLHPLDREATAAAYDAAADPARRALYDVEYRTIGKEDSVVRWVAAKGRGVFDASGNCLRVVGTAIDITARKATETALAESEARYRRLFDSMDEGFCVIEFLDGPEGPMTDYVHVEANAAYATNAGIPGIVGKRLREIVSASEADAWSEIYRRVLVTGESIRFDRELVETGRHLEIAAFRVEPGSRRQVAVIFQDVTGRKRAEAALRELNDTLEARVAQRTAELEAAHEQLRQSQKLEAMGSLTGGVAHDFNNLLTPIVGALDMLQRKGLGGAREQRLISGAAQSAERARTLVQRLLAFARRQPLQSVAVDLGELVRSMAELVASTTGPQIRVVVEVAEGLPPARADPNQLEMALLNLSVNARDAMPEGGTLRISASMGDGARAGLPPGRYLCLSVADTGTGMDEATLARAVEPFFSTKGIGKGTGLGLSMVHGLASQLGGALTISSRPRLGTNVELWLRQAEAVAEPAPAAAEAEPVRGRGTVLVVDDEEFVRMTTAEMLAELGFAVVEAASAEEALRLIDAGAGIDTVVTDHLMTGMTGVELALAVRERRAELPVLIVSGYAEVEGVAPDLPRLTKPFRKDELAASLAGLAGAG